MWNAVSENEYNYVRSMEEKNQRIRLLNGLGSAALLLTVGKSGAEEDQEFRAYPAELNCKDIYKWFYIK